MKQPLIKHIVFLILISLMAIHSATIYAQYNSANSGAVKPDVLLRKGDYAYKDFKFTVAANYYEAYLEKSIQSQSDVLAKLADCYWQMRDYKKALTVYEVLYPDQYQGATQNERLRIGELYARNGHYKKAAIWLGNIVGYTQKAMVYNDTVVINEMKADSSDWKLGFLNINTSYREFSPFCYNNTLFFSSNKPLSTKSKAFGWDGDNYAHLFEIPIANLENVTPFVATDSTLNENSARHKVSKIVEGYECGDNEAPDNAIGPFINKPNLKTVSSSFGSLVKGLDKLFLNVGPISIDKNNHFYFSANYKHPDSKGINRICLMEAIYSVEGIKSIIKMPFGDSRAYSVMHPSINNDGTFIVLSSDKPTGIGKYDLYYSKRKSSTQAWDTLKAFGSNINTVGNEVFPTITQNGFLYYSSDGAPGLGGLDIFKISLTDAIKGKVEAVHLGYPINSSADDFGWAQLDSTGLKGYFTSDRLNSNDNIFSFYQVYDPASKKLRKSFIDGLVLEKNSKTPIKGSTVFLYNVAEDSVYIAKSDINGKYHILINSSSKVLIKAVDTKYINDCLSTNIFFETHPKDSIQQAPRELLLDIIKPGYVWRLSKINYELNNWEINSDSRAVLDSLVLLLKDHPVSVEIGSHTDNRESAKSNRELSNRRAESIVSYLIVHGIDYRRVTSKGYGKSQLINPCPDGVPCSEDDHEFNDRIQVKVTGFTSPQKQTIEINTDLFKEGEVISGKLFPKDFFDECK